MWIDVYDFDGTIFRGDSTMAFWLYCVRKKPGLLKHLPRQARALALMALGRWNLTRGKGEFLRFVRDIDLDAMAKQFWADEKVLRRVGAWFDKRDTALPIVIASASPEAMLAPIAWKFRVQHLVGTRIDEKTGALTSPNCKGAVKIERIGELIPGFQVRAMYTDDARADGPLLALAQQKYLVTRGSVKRIWKD